MTDTVPTGRRYNLSHARDRANPTDPAVALWRDICAERDRAVERARDAERRLTMACSVIVAVARSRPDGARHQLLRDQASDVMARWEAETRTR